MSKKRAPRRAPFLSKKSNKKEIKMDRMLVKNKTPAGLQITAEQIIREAKERAIVIPPPPVQKIADQEELDDYRLLKRKEFEDTLRRNRTAVGAWIRYAAWEENQHELERARSIFERGLDVDHKVQPLWIKYAEMEMRNKNANRARNVYDRVVALLPRVDLFWYRYTYMEELLENVAGARQVFERWMEWEPIEEAWMAFVKFETRYNEPQRASKIFERFVALNPIPKNWLKWAKFEESNGHLDLSRSIYEQCMTKLGPEFIDQNFYVSFGRFETRAKEIERARIIYKYAMDKLPVGQKENLYNVYTVFEKQFGGRDAVEEAVVAKRRLKYEQDILSNPSNYDTWFDYIRLEEGALSAPEKVRDIYERAISNIPLITEKKYWRRYVYLWLLYAVFEESVAKETDRAKKIYSKLIELIPHKSFTFAKVWLLYAKFLIRQGDLPGARKTLGMGIGMAPKDRLYRGYIDLEMSLREFDRIRVLYQKYLEWNHSNCLGWIRFTELEVMLGETERARQVFKIAIGLPDLDLPEVLWKAYIDFEVNEGEWENARELYTSLLDRTDHVKVHVSFANFEFTALDNGSLSGRLAKARKYFTDLNETYRRRQVKDERSLLLDSWLEFENQHGNAHSIQSVQDQLPRSVKKRRRVQDESGQVTGWEEYYDFVFPGDDVEKPSQKFLAMAHQWKMASPDDDDSEEGSDDDDE